MDQPEAGPSRPQRPALIHLGSSDEVIEVEATKAVPRPKRITRTKAPSTTTISGTKKTRKSTRAPSTVVAKSKGKGKAKEAADDTILVGDSTDEEDEDEPIFVGIASKLAQKYTFKSASSNSISSASSASSNGITPIPPPVLAPTTPDTGQDDKPKLKITPVVLLPPPSPPGKAPTIPTWLGKSSVLLQIPNCVVCKIRWKKENGAARWVSLRDE
jgi:hypothetical protein